MKNGQTAEQYQCAVCLLVKIWNMEELLTDVPERKTSRKTSRKNEKMTKMKNATGGWIKIVPSFKHVSTGGGVGRATFNIPTQNWK